MDLSSYTGFIIILLILLLLSGFFSMSETALMSLSKIRLKQMVEEKVNGANVLEKLLENRSKLLEVILVLNNLVNISAAAIATFIAINIFGKVIGIIVAILIMTMLIIIFCEITPKTIGKQKCESISLSISKPINACVLILKPLVFVLTAISNVFIKLLGGDPKAADSFITAEELRTMVGVSEKEGVLEDVEREMIFNVFDFGDMQVREVMLQRVDIVALDVKISYEEVIDIIKREQFSRFPIYDDTIDNIVGIFNVKDLIIGEKLEVFNIKDYVREPYYTFEFKQISEVFADMKKSRNHMSIVLDEYGGTVGILTMEDIVEEIVGDIEDEFDAEEVKIEIVKEDEYIVDGGAKLDEISELIGVNMESEELDSVAGLIIEELGRIPEEKDEIEINQVKFIVEEVDKNRIKKVRIFT